MTELCELHPGIKNFIENGRIIIQQEEVIEKKTKVVVSAKIEREKTCAITVLDINNCRLSPLNLAALARAAGLN